jgi:hypothetical protein
MFLMMNLHGFNVNERFKFIIPIRQSWEFISNHKSKQDNPHIFFKNEIRQSGKNDNLWKHVYCMRKLGTIDLEILHLAINENGKFDENNLENSNLKRLGVGKILDSLASLKDRKMISLNKDGSFTITDLAREILWNERIPIWARVLRLLQIKSCSMEQISNILKISIEELSKEVEKLRKSQFVLMSPQRQDDKLVKVFEILSEGMEEIDRTETEGFNKIIFGKQRSESEILDTVDEIIKEIQDSVSDEKKKERIIEKLVELKIKLKI